MINVPRETWSETLAVQALMFHVERLFFLFYNGLQMIAKFVRRARLEFSVALRFSYPTSPIF